MIKYRKPEHASWKKLGSSKSILLDLNSGHYYTLNETATVMWELLTSSMVVNDVIQQTAQIFKTDSETVKDDVCELVEDFVEKGLLCEDNLSTEEKSDKNCEMEISDNPYIKPVVEQHEAVKEVTAGTDYSSSSSNGGGGSTTIHYWYPN